MRIIYIGPGPYDSPLFQFDTQVGTCDLCRNASHHFLPENPFKLPWQLRSIIKETERDERLIVFTSTPRGVMAITEALSLERDREAKVVFMPEVTDDRADMKRLGRYAIKTDGLLFSDPQRRDCAMQLWGDGVPSFSLDPPAIEATSTIEPAPGLHLLYHDSITPDCNLEAAINALAQLPWLTMQVVGTGKGRYAMPIVKLSRRLGTEPRIKWEGDEHFNEILHADDKTILLSTNLDHNLQQQTIATSYLRQGAIIATPDSPTARHLISDAGILLPAVSAESLAETLSRLKEDTGWRHNLSQKAISSGKKRYSVERFFGNLMEIYRSL